MPNIIEQQDLLKGLPDARIALLLQNPVPDIPPFLVAAEAQRRQAIRQQFAANAPQESVVDSLTKQLANVPQNISAPAQTPPNVPPTPQMQGVMALQQQQAIQQAAQQAQPQAMRAGGVVRRFDVGGYVAPKSQITPMWTIPKVGDWVGAKLGDFYKFATTPYSEMEKAKEDPRDFDMSLPDVNLNNVNVPQEYKVPLAPRPKAPPQEPKSTRDGTSPENKDKAAPNRDAEFRDRLEALYASEGPSDWEKAQGWFAMAEQFLDPSKTTMQSVAGAGRAFADSAAAQARAEREAALQSQKAMLEYDMAIEESRRAAEAAAAKDQREFQQKMQERGTPSADAAVNAIIRSMSDADKEIADLTKDFAPGQPIPPDVAARINEINSRKAGLNRQLVSIMDRGGFVNRKLVTEDELNSLGPL